MIYFGVGRWFFGRSWDFFCGGGEGVITMLFQNQYFSAGNELIKCCPSNLKPLVVSLFHSYFHFFVADTFLERNLTQYLIVLPSTRKHELMPH